MMYSWDTAVEEQEATQVRGGGDCNNNKDGKVSQSSHQRSDSTILVRSSLQLWCY